MTKTTGHTYDYVCFSDLAYEFEPFDKKEVEKKIKRRLKYHKLGDYNQERIDYIRQLRNDLTSEISRTTKSKYFHKSKTNYAELEDFDIEQMIIDFNKKFTKVDKGDLRDMMNFAIYLFHMR